jgi:predicted XRE-type DNA-binding protein
MNAEFKATIDTAFAPRPHRGKPKDVDVTAAIAHSETPRIATLMALAIHTDQLLREGQLKDQAELAELAGVTRARVTQVMNLLLLAPEIQEALLFGRGFNGAVERELRALGNVADWRKQWESWLSFPQTNCPPRCS